MTGTSEKVYKINITNPKYCKVLSDTAEGTTYGEVKEFGEAMEMGITASVATGQLYGNGVIQDASSRLTGMTASYSTTKIPVEVIADIYNYKVTDGILQVEAGKQADYIAIGYEVEQTSGKNEYVWLLKGRPRPMNETIKQSEANIQYSTDSIEVDFVQRKSDKMLKYFADAAHPDFTEKQAKKWFEAGPSAPVKA